MGTVVPALFVAPAMPCPTPRGYGVVITPGQGEGALVRLALVVRTNEHPDGAGLVMSAQTTDAVAFVGALVDARERVIRYVDVWFQDGTPLLEQSSDSASEMVLNNTTLDGSWQAANARIERLEQAGRTGSPGTIWTGREVQRGQVWIVDLGAKTCRESGWSVCADDAALAGWGLPTYSASLHRYLMPGAKGEGALGAAPLASVWAASPTGGKAVPLDEALGLDDKRVCVNAWGGGMVVRPHLAMAYGAMIDWLSGAPEDDRVGRTRAMHNGDHTGRSSAGQAGVGLLSEREGDPLASLVERTFLRVRLLHESVSEVIGAVEAAQTPLLSVDEQAFRVSVGAPGEGAAWAWTCRAHLVGGGLGVGGAARAVGGGVGARPVYVPASRWVRSVYSPVNAGSEESEGSLRLRSAAAVSDKGVVTLEATLTTPHRLAVGAKDVLNLTFAVGGRRVTLRATWSASPTKARNEVVVSATGEGLGAPATAELKNIPPGKTIAGVLVRPMQVLGPACDLYALGILAIRSLLVTRERDLGTSVDDVKSLAGRVAERWASDGQAGEDRLMALKRAIVQELADDAELREMMGPIRLMWGMPAGMPVEGLIGRELWGKVLAGVVETLPGYPFSAFVDASEGSIEAPARALHGLRQSLYTVLVGLRPRVLRGAAADGELVRILRRRISKEA